MERLFSRLHLSLKSPLLHQRPAATFPHITYLKISLLSTAISTNNNATTSNLQPVIPDFLLKECGLLQSELSAVIRRCKTLLKCRSAHTAREVVKVLRDSGCTEEQVRKIITKYPMILCLRTAQQLMPKIELLKTVGVAGKDLVYLILKEPRFLGSNLDKTLSGNIKYVQSLWESNASVSIALKRAPQLLVYRDGPEIWEKRLRFLASFGLLEDEIKELVKKDPQVLKVSTDKIQKNMDFLVHTAELPVNTVLKYPMLFYYSVEGRLKPRLQVIKLKSALQPSKRLRGPVVALCLSEQKFLDKYVKCSTDAKK